MDANMVLSELAWTNMLIVAVVILGVANLIYTAIKFDKIEKHFDKKNRK